MATLRAMKKLKASLVWLLVTALWLPTLSWWFDPPEPERQRADRLARAHLAAFEEGDSGAALREGNPEWDLMRRLFTVLALSSRALRNEAERARDLRAVDAILDETLAYARDHGSYGFLLAYSRRAPFRFAADRSLFVEGEIAMMLGARLAVAHDDEHATALRYYSARIAEQIRSGPVLCGESYPDECWTFCNTTALAALRMADVTLGTDHGELFARWTATAKARLLDADTGLLATSYTYNGAILDGPEGSSLWMSAHNLRLIDPAFASDQYRRARDALGVTILDFGYAREWPHLGGLGDIDSGPVIPLLGASPGSSGLALLASASFDDRPYFDSLVRSLELVAAPRRDRDRLRYRAAGPMGDAVAFYAHEVGPLWDHIIERTNHVDSLAHAR